MPHVNYIAVLVAAIVVFVLGWLWYSPLLFYKPWMRARGMDPAVAMAWCGASFSPTSSRISSRHSALPIGWARYTSGFSYGLGSR
jgi:uncharacterized membrane protein YjfL (UPF0719 family)